MVVPFVTLATSGPVSSTTPTKSQPRTVPSPKALPSNDCTTGRGSYWLVVHTLFVERGWMSFTISGILGHVRHLHQKLARARLGHGEDVLDEFWSVVAVDPDN